MMPTHHSELSQTPPAKRQPQQAWLTAHLPARVPARLPAHIQASSQASLRHASLYKAHHHFVFQLMLDFKMSLRDYLHHHFVDGATLAQMAGISIARLNALVDSAAVPAPSYLVVGRSITSAVFGCIDDVDADAGRYFRPENLRWLRIATQAPQGFERQAVVNCLSQELLDAFTMAGISGEAATAKVASFLPHFFNGTFALCAANPANGYAIARKELLQERLSALTNNGANAHPAGVSQAELQQLIDDFAAACMPFSPAEYARSSRKRLVDDLRLKLQPAAA